MTTILEGMKNDITKAVNDALSKNTDIAKAQLSFGYKLTLGQMHKKLKSNYPSANSFNSKPLEEQKQLYIQMFIDEYQINEDEHFACELDMTYYTQDAGRGVLPIDDNQWLRVGIDDDFSFSSGDIGSLLLSKETLESVGAITTESDSVEKDFKEQVAHELQRVNLAELLGYEGTVSNVLFSNQAYQALKAFNQEPKSLGDVLANKDHPHLRKLVDKLNYLTSPIAKKDFVF